jgi:hypothetical protein
VDGSWHVSPTRAKRLTWITPDTHVTCEVCRMVATTQHVCTHPNHHPVRQTAGRGHIRPRRLLCPDLALASTATSGVHVPAFFGSAKSNRQNGVDNRPVWA